MNHHEIVQCFDGLFAGAYRTRLQGGADEPVYTVQADGSAVIYFRADYASSALHEVAHWCIAGRSRRRLEDYGYWYSDRRGRDEQSQFHRVEARPQALEWIFSVAADVSFRVSADNFDLSASNPDELQRLVLVEARRLHERMPPRARQFADALALMNQRRGSVIDSGVT
ncbi:MAG: elongation factor P hydroxylase [Proteobacteria bacterium]|nr:elongation factor P hydroxylase [Pseudomonadota bacterium]